MNLNDMTRLARAASLALACGLAVSLTACNDATSDDSGAIEKTANSTPASTGMDLSSAENAAQAVPATQPDRRETLNASGTPGQRITNTVDNAASRGVHSDPSSNVNLTWDTMLYDFGKLYDETPAQGRFTLTNAGEGPVTIQRVNASCGCTATNAAALAGKVVQPGQSVTIETAYTPKVAGTATKAITVTAFDENNRTRAYQLNVRGEYIPAVNIPRKIAQFGTVIAGDAGVTVLDIESRDPNFEVLALGAPGADLPFTWAFERLEADPAKPDYPGRGRLTLTSDPLAPIGNYSSPIPITMRVKADPAANAQPTDSIYNVTVAMSVKGQVEPEPRFIRVPVSAPGDAFEGRTTVKHLAGMPFTITRIDFVEGQLEGMTAEAVAVQGTDGKLHEIILKGQAPDGLNRFAGEVLVYTDLENHGPLRIRFTGVIRSAAQTPPIRRPANISNES